jgi:hypothetical protein
MRLRLEQCLREGWGLVVGSTFILPIWLMGASVHRSHWSSLLSVTSWSVFVLSWGGLIWGLLVSALLIFWIGFAHCEGEGRLATVWGRASCALLLLGMCFFLAIPGWRWTGELVGTTLSSTPIYLLKSMSVPLGAIVIGSLLAAFLSSYLVVIISFVGTLFVSGHVWAELVG